MSNSLGNKIQNRKVITNNKNKYTTQVFGQQMEEEKVFLKKQKYEGAAWLANEML